MADLAFVHAAADLLDLSDGEEVVVDEASEVALTPEGPAIRRTIRSLNFSE